LGTLGTPEIFHRSFSGTALWT